MVVIQHTEHIKNTFKFDPKYIYMHRVAYCPETLSQADN